MQYKSVAQAFWLRLVSFVYTMVRGGREMPTEPIAVRVDAERLRVMRAYRDEIGVPVSKQFERGARLLLEQQGWLKPQKSLKPKGLDVMQPKAQDTTKRVVPGQR